MEDFANVILQGFSSESVSSSELVHSPHPFNTDEQFLHLNQQYSYTGAPRILQQTHKRYPQYDTSHQNQYDDSAENHLSRPSDPKIPRFENCHLISHGSEDRAAPNSIRIYDTQRSRLTSIGTSQNIDSSNSVCLNSTSSGSISPVTNSADIRSSNRIYQYLLNSGYTGRNILAAYDQYERTGNDQVFNFFRPKLAHIVMNAVMVPGQKVKRGTFVQLRSSTTEYLTREKGIVWFTESNGKRPAKGFYFSAYRTLYNQGKLVTPVPDTERDEEIERINHELRESQEIKVINNNSIALWSGLHLVRIEYGEDSIDAYSVQLPIIQAPDGWRLLCQDFLRMHGAKANNLIENKETIADKIIKLAKDKNKKKKIPEIVECFRTYENEGKIVLAFFVLALLFNGSKLPNGKLKRSDTVKFFIDFIEIEDDEDVQIKVKESQRTLNDAKIDAEELTPRVVLCGKTPSQSRFFTVVNEATIYEAQDLVRAIDRCFKCMYAFKSCRHFGRLVPHIWATLEDFVYNIQDDEHFHPVAQTLTIALKNVNLDA